MTQVKAPESLAKSTGVGRIALAAVGLMAAAAVVVVAQDRADARARAAAAGGELVNRVTITTRGEYRYIESNGVPDHQPGEFPNRGNPNRITEQKHTYRVPLHPTAGEKPTDAGGMPYGVAINGVPFDPGTAEVWHPGVGRTHGRDMGWRYDALSGKIDLGLDASNAHVQPNGAYHYHGLPLGLLNKAGADGPRMLLVGYAADGFAIYNQYGHENPKDAASPLKKLRSSWKLKRGTRPDGEKGPGGPYDGTFVQDFEYVADSGDLDECNGRFGVTPEHPDGVYHYVITEQFPFIGRSLKGTPDDSFRRRGPSGAGGGPEGGPGGDGRRPPPGGPGGPRGPGFGPPPR